MFLRSITAGAGAPQHDPDWRNYALQAELYDILDLMTHRRARTTPPSSAPRAAG